MLQDLPLPRVDFKVVGIALLEALLAGCGGSDTSPSRVSTETGVSPATLRVAIDSRGSSAAIVSHSDVRFEAAVAPGANVREVRIDFGDGSSSGEATARHVYTTEGTYMATATFTMSSGQQVRAAQSVIVKSLDGLWSHAVYNESARRVDVRSLSLSQTGRQIVGTYKLGGGPDRPVTGTLSGERDIQLSAGGESFDGIVPSGVKGPGVLWPLRTSESSVSDRTLPFRFAFGEPSAAPVANLMLKRPEGFIVEGLEIGFDASASSGDDLAYFVEYGDGRYTTDPVSQHAMEIEGRRTARLTVVDRFGRVGVVTPRLDVDSVTVCYPVCYHTWVHAFVNPATGQYESRSLVFGRHEGRYVEGHYGHPSRAGSRFTGHLSGSHDIQLALDGGGIEFTGTLRAAYNVPDEANQLALTLRGGSADGQLLAFRRNTSP